MMKLNGWQRLWVLASALWAATLIGLVITSWRSEADIHDHYRWALDNVPEHVLEGSIGNMTRRELTFQERSERKEEILSRYNFELEDLPNEQLKTVVRSIMFWLVTSAFAYLLGWMIAWVLRGFRQDRTNVDKA